MSNIERDPKPGREHNLYFKFNRFLERHFPRELYRRSLIIMIAPLVLLQILTAGIVLNSYWDGVTKILGRSLSREIGLLTELYEKSDRSPAAIAEIEKIANQRLRLGLTIKRNAQVPHQDVAPFWQLFENKMHKYLTRDTGRKFFINSASPDEVEILVQAEPDVVFRIVTDAERARATSTPWLLALMLLSTLLLAAISTIFLRNQIRPIVELARAARNFGLGRDTSEFSPRGAVEVRQAGQSFLDMRRRIARHVEQRTAMLAGVSHDLRTILTRFKLELAVLGENAKLEPLRRDVDEMQRMIEDYMNFVRGDGGEQAADADLRQMLQTSITATDRKGDTITLKTVPDIKVKLKQNAFRRLMANVLGNAVRHASKVEVSGTVSGGRLWLFVDDNGPGIPANRREDVFRPFVRLDESRNLDTTGSGLGLAIALDIAHAHGGEITLEDSALGGLRVNVRIPL
jgi:two-component system, OmpR family, osmolarity sensor histidine kinase EnvZ